MRHRRQPATTFLALATTLALALVPGVASAHAFLQSAVPAVGSTVPRPPSQVVIEFTEGVEPLFSSIVVRGPAGQRVDSGAPHTVGDDTHLAVSLQPLPAGTYKVTWHVTATDTHKTQGSFLFTVAR
jgi:methionine-rich copper-binding protein CopC